MADVSFTSGFDELEDRLLKLPLLTARTELKRALNAAAKPIEKAARDKAKSYGFSTKRANTIRRKAGTPRKSNNYNATVRVAPAIGSGKGGYVLKLWDQGFMHKGGKFLGPRPMLLPAIIEKKDEALKIFKEDLVRRIEKWISKNRVKGKR